jgi:predicted DNA-binding transcriptional regulator AlpA
MSPGNWGSLKTPSGGLKPGGSYPPTGVWPASEFLTRGQSKRSEIFIWADRERVVEKLLNPSQLATLLNVKPGTVYSWLSRGVPLPPSIRIGGSTRWREESVKRWIERMEKAKRRKNFED